jgi:hypothetical protein
VTCGIVYLFDHVRYRDLFLRHFARGEILRLSMVPPTLRERVLILRLPVGKQILKIAHLAPPFRLYCLERAMR